MQCLQTDKSRYHLNHAELSETSFRYAELRSAHVPFIIRCEGAKLGSRHVSQLCAKRECTTTLKHSEFGSSTLRLINVKERSIYNDMVCRRVWRKTSVAARLLYCSWRFHFVYLSVLSGSCTTSLNSTHSACTWIYVLGKKKKKSSIMLGIFVGFLLTWHIFRALGRNQETPFKFTVRVWLFFFFFLVRPRVTRMNSNFRSWGRSPACA